MKNAIFRANRLLWCIGVIVLSLMACKKDDTPEPTPESMLPGVNYLGRGYNVFGDYAVPDDVKSPILQYNQHKVVTARNKNYRIPEAAYFAALENNTFSSIYGHQSDAFQRSLTAMAGGDAAIPFFGGGLTAVFDQNQYNSTAYAFVEVQNVISLWKLSLPRDPMLLREMINAQFKTDLDNMAPRAFFEKYGTHLLTEVVIGAKAYQRSAVIKNEKTKNMNLGLAAEVFFKAAIGKINLNVQAQYKEMEMLFRENAIRRYNFHGGKAEYGTCITQQGNNYDKWIESISSNPVLCDFTNQSLFPLWELCTDADRKNELLQTFNGLVAENSIKPADTDISITDVAAVTFSDMPSCPDEQTLLEMGLEGYQVLCADLNEGTPINGSNIYLFYRVGTGVEPALTELTFIEHAGTPTPPGFEKLETNFNHMAGGMWVYLCQKKGTSKSPIRQLRIIKGAGAPLPPGFDWVRNYQTGQPQDLNNGTLGLPIWLAYSREVPNW